MNIGLHDDKREFSNLALTPDSLKNIPLDSYRHNSRYPFLLHRNARRIHVRTTEDSAPASEPQARLTSGLPVVQDSPFRVVRGLDFLKVSFWLEWNPQVGSFLQILDFMKKQVQETENDSIPVFKENGF